MRQARLVRKLLEPNRGTQAKAAPVTEPQLPADKGKVWVRGGRGGVFVPRVGWKLGADSFPLTDARRGAAFWLYASKLHHGESSQTGLSCEPNREEALRTAAPVQILGARIGNSLAVSQREMQKKAQEG